ncbi:LysE family translocator [Histidinibacterium aquaticum]|nr:LysE family translocator [Histidinibacterium aquaticum]
METSAVLTYLTTLAALTLTPGPLVAVLAARSANADRAGACAIAVGICAGDVIVILAICAGLGFWLQANPEVFSVAKYGGAVALCWMAWRMWFSVKADEDEASPPTGVLAAVAAGLLICLSSPQTVVIYLILLPRVLDLTAIQPNDAAILILLTALVLLAIFMSVILLAEGMQRLLNSEGGSRLWQRSTSMVVALSAVWIMVS